MILVKIFLAWIFLKSAPTCSRRSTQYQINRTDFVLGYEMGGKGQKRRISGSPKSKILRCEAQMTM